MPTQQRQPGFGPKLLLLLVVGGLVLTWWKAPAFFRGGAQGICGLELRYPTALAGVQVARVDGRDTARAVASGTPIAIPCGQPLEIRYFRTSGAPQEPQPGGAPETRTLGVDELKPGVTLVELR